MPFLLILILVPLVEMFLLFAVSEEIGAVATFLLVIGTAVLGVYVLKLQGVSTLRRVNERLARGDSPATDVLAGLFLAIAGVLLLIPGVVTDVLGAILLVPPLRLWLAGRLLRAGLNASRFSMHFGGMHQRPGSRESGHSGSGQDVYEGEFTRERPPSRQLDRQDDRNDWPK